ncbi:unnamed protein product, partial [Protopolystoma xenopodis]
GEAVCVGDVEASGTKGSNESSINQKRREDCVIRGPVEVAQFSVSARLRHSCQSRQISSSTGSSVDSMSRSLHARWPASEFHLSQPAPSEASEASEAGLFIMPTSKCSTRRAKVGVFRKDRFSEPILS